MFALTSKMCKEKVIFPGVESTGSIPLPDLIPTALHPANDSGLEHSMNCASLLTDVVYVFFPRDAPFVGETNEKTMEKIVEGKITWPTQIKTDAKFVKKTQN